MSSTLRPVRLRWGRRTVTGTLSLFAPKGGLDRTRPSPLGPGSSPVPTLDNTPTVQPFSGDVFPTRLTPAVLLVLRCRSGDGRRSTDSFSVLVVPFSTRSPIPSPFLFPVDISRVRRVQVPYWRTSGGRGEVRKSFGGRGRVRSRVDGVSDGVSGTGPSPGFKWVSGGALQGRDFTNPLPHHWTLRRSVPSFSG